MSEWWLCPNGRCEHGAILHDVYDMEDQHPTCCAEGCDCGRTSKPDEPAFFSCDWGDCDREAVDSRWSPGHGWLPVCSLHRTVKG